MSGWVAILDKESGENYYHNSITGETTWDTPADYVAPAAASVPAPVPAPAPAAPVAAVSSDWTAVKDASSGDTYYFNPKTGETTWDTPPGFVAADASAAPASSPAKPSSPAAAPAPAPAAAVPQKASGWQAVLDSSSGEYYYFNAATGETSWDKPAEFAAASPSALAASPAAPPPGVAPARKVISADTKAAWKSVLERAKADAKPSSPTAEGADAAAPAAEGAPGFEGLRAFAESMKQKRERKVADSAAAAGGGAEGEAAPAVDKLGGDLAQFLLVEVVRPPPCEMEQYAEEYFQLNRKGLFGKRTTVEKILGWKAKIINTALKKMGSGDLAKQAKQCFRNITGYMGDRSTTKEDGGHAEKLLKQALTAPEELRDEVYCQLIKQTTRNPSRCDVVDSSQTEEGEVGKYAQYCAGRVKMAGVLGPRRETPTGMEIDACKHRLPVVLRVYLMDGSYEVMPTVSWTTAGQMNKMMAHRLGIKNAEAFSLYEITPDGEERYLDKEERLLDMVAYWQRLYEEEKKLEEGKSYRVAYKTHMYFDPDPGDEAAERMMYMQAVYDVVSSRYPCNEEDCKTLAGLQLQVELGTKRLPDLETKLKRFLPAKLCVDERLPELSVDIQKRHKTHSGKSSIEVQRAYLRHVKAWKIYGSQFFHVEPQMSVDLPDEVFLAVNPRGVLIINPETKDVLSEYPYSEIPTWGHSGASFVLHIGNLLKQTKLYFQTEQGKEINDLVRAYVNHLCA